MKKKKDVNIEEILFFAETPEEKINSLLEYIDQSQERYVECDTVRKFLV